MGISSALSGAVGQIPSGSVTAFAGADAPSGWLLCFGQAVSRTEYASLFAVVGTTYGSGNGSTTFNLPDLRGRVVAGQDDMGGTSANRLTNQSGGLDGDTLGGTGGSETNTHNHYQSNGYDGGSFYAKNFSLMPRSKTETVSRAVATMTQSSAVGRFDSTENETMNIVQPTIILNYIIKA